MSHFVPNCQPMFPEWLDSSMLATFKSCPFKFYLEYILHYKPKMESVHLVAGGAYARGLEVARRAFFEEGKPAAEAEGLGLGALLKAYGDFECPADSAKSAERTAGALEFYFDTYPLGSCGAIPLEIGGKRAIEFTFAEPIDAVHPVTGNPLLYCGGSDMLCSYAGGNYVEDDKTTSQLGASWSKQWDLRSQFTGYCWGHQKASQVNINGVLVRGVSILKTKYETQQAITYRAPWQIDEWYAVLLDAVEEMKRYWERSWWRQSLDHACSEYGGCGYRQLCLSPDKQPWLDTYFERRLWNPLTRQETVLT